NARERDFSHGCVRVEHADELAEHLLQGVPGSSRAEIDAAFASAARDSVVRLAEPVRVHIMYWTAWVDEQGVVQFRDDVYGLDHVVDTALGRHGPVVFVTPEARHPQRSARIAHAPALSAIVPSWRAGSDARSRSHSAPRRSSVNVAK